MSKTDFDLKLASIEAVDPAMATDPNMPVANALQEAEELYVWCQADKDALVKANLDWALVDDLPARTGACRYIQSEWAKEYQTQEDAQKEWKTQSPAAFKLRDDLVHHFLWAYRKVPDLLARTQKISEGSGNADMIQDLSDLSVLGKANTAPLAAINLDLTLLDKAETTSGQMASLLAQANGAKKEGNNQTKLLRDKAYAHLKEAVDEIRDAGKYVFYQNEQRYKGYVSSYFKKHNAETQNKKTQAAASTTASK